MSVRSSTQQIKTNYPAILCGCQTLTSSWGIWTATAHHSSLVAPWNPSILFASNCYLQAAPVASIDGPRTIVSFGLLVSIIQVGYQLVTSKWGNGTFPIF